MRRGFYAILDTGYVADADWESKASALVRGGAVCLQVRAKGRELDDAHALALRVEPICRQAGVPLIINDHLEVALAIAGAGLHIGQEDLTPEAARKALGQDRILGWSTHSAAQAGAAIERAHLLSYFAVGPVYATGTKPTYIPVGLELVRTVAGLNPPIPFFAIGGINLNNAPAILEAGAAGLVAVSDVLQAADSAAMVAEYHKLILNGSGA